MKAMIEVLNATSEVLNSTAGELSHVRDPVAGILIGKGAHHHRFC
jgi:hypothetical protein